MMPYPPQLAIQPLVRPPQATLSVPGSKSVTNRALVLAAVAGQGVCRLTGALDSEDTRVMVAALQALGFDVEPRWDLAAPEILLRHPERGIQANQAELFLGNSGTSMRFLTALVALGHGVFRLDGVPRMRQRPIEELLDGLRQLGVDAQSEMGNGCPPVVVRASGLAGGEATIDVSRSSQFLSALLLVAPFARQGLTIRTTGPRVSEPYIAMSTAMLRGAGYAVHESQSGFLIPADATRRWPADYAIEPDASAASYWLAAAAIGQGRVTVLDLGADGLQGDARFADLLGEMGCRVERCSAGTTVHGRALRGIDCDMNAISDTAMTLAAVACFAEGPTTIRNIAHVRHKETDRIDALATELRRLGAAIDERPDGLTVTPRPLHGATVQTYDDHRMAMSLALIGLATPGVVIDNPGCVAKTYPGFWDDLALLRS